MSTKPKKKFKITLRNVELYLMMIPGLAYLFINNYIPIGGLVIAFKKFDYRLGIWGSPWTGFSNFTFLFKTKDSSRGTSSRVLWSAASRADTLVFFRIHIHCTPMHHLRSSDSCVEH